MASDPLPHPTFVEVDLGRLSQNFLAIQRAVTPALVMPILKANAYGHGLVEVGRHLVARGARYLGVAFLSEGASLREAGITVPILVLGGILGDQVPHFLDYDLTVTASSVEKLQQIDDAARRRGVTAKVHLKIDTGMERIGVHYYSAGGFLEAARRCEHCRVEGIFSHLASSETRDLTSARCQLGRFADVLQAYDKLGAAPPIRHIANSGAILQLPESHLDMVRAGLLLYGVYPSREVARTIVVHPVLAWKSRVAYFKVVKPGHAVSYGSTWQTDHLVRVVTIPVGYGDGYFRSLSNRSAVIIRGKRYPVVGRICMDQMMVNLEWDTAYNGDEVILLGAAGEEAITCDDLAEWAGTIPYEVLTNIGARVPRIYSTPAPAPGA